MGILEAAARFVDRIAEPAENPTRASRNLVVLANVIRIATGLLCNNNYSPASGKFILPASIPLSQENTGDYLEGDFLVVPTQALEPVIKFFKLLSESTPSEIIAIAQEGTGRLCLTPVELACGLAEVYNATLTAGLCEYQEHNPDSFGVTTLNLSREKSFFAYLLEVGDVVIPSITPLPLTPATYFDEIKPLLSNNDGLEIALGVNGFAQRSRIEDLLFPYERADLDTYVVTVFPRTSR
jgi:hypothetical protein